MVEEKDASKATIIVYGEGHDIDTGINRLENSLEGDFDTKEFKDGIIKKLSKTQVCYRLRNILLVYKTYFSLLYYHMYLVWKFTRNINVTDQSCNYDASLK